MYVSLDIIQHTLILSLNRNKNFVLRSFRILILFPLDFLHLFLLFFILGISYHQWGILVVVYVGFWSNQIPLRLKLQKDRKINFFFLFKLGIKVCRMITKRYIHFNPLQNTIKYYFTSNLSEGLKRYVG
jgi:hypothetical protein